MELINTGSHTNNDLTKAILISEAINAGMQVVYNSRMDKIACMANFANNGETKIKGFAIGKESLPRKDYYHNTAIVAEYCNFVSKKNLYNIKDFEAASTDKSINVELDASKILDFYKNNKVFEQYKKMASTAYAQVIDAARNSNTFAPMLQELNEREAAINNVLYNGTEWQ